MSNDIQRKIDQALSLGATPAEVSQLAGPQYAHLVPDVNEPVAGPSIPYGEEFDSDTSPRPPVATGDTPETPPIDIPTPAIAPEDGPPVRPRGVSQTDTARMVPEDMVEPDFRPNTGLRPPFAPPRSGPGSPLDFDGLDTFIATQMKYNTIVSGLTNLQDRGGIVGMMNEEAVPGYDPFSDMDRIAGYPPELFVSSQSPGETDRIKRQYDRDYYVDRVAQESGWEGTVSSVASGAMNPLYLIPYFGWGGRSAAGALKIGGEAAVGEILTEGAYHAGLDYTREMSESVFNVAAGTIAGSVLGKLLQRGDVITPEEFAKVSKEIEKDIKRVDTEEGPIINLKEDTGDVPQADGRFTKIAAKLSPVRILSSVNPLSRKLGALLGEQSIVRTDGIRPAIETLVKKHDSYIVKGLNAYNESWRSYKQRLPRGDRTSKQEFGEQVAYALRNGDEHAIPEVQMAAQKIRREVMEPIRRRAIDAGLLDESVTAPQFAKSYFPRQYNFAKIDIERGAFVRDIADFVKKENPEVSAEEAMDIARDVGRQLTDDPTSHIKHKDPTIRVAGALEGRTLAIPDNVLSKWLVNEPDIVLRSWSHDMATQIEFTRQFGDTSIETQLKQVEDEWNKIIEAASNEDPKLAGKYQRAKSHDLELLRALRDRLLNKYKTPDNPRSGWVRAGRLVRNANILRLLGGMTLSAIPDLARPLYNHHFGSYGKAIKSIVLSPELRKMAKADLERMGIALDLTLHSRLRAITEADYMPQQFSRPEAFIDNLVTGSGGRYPDFGRVSLMSHWNANMKLITGLMSQDGLIGAIMKNQMNAKRLQRGGISEDMAKRIKDQINQHGSKNGSLRVGNSDKWDDLGAAEVFESAILKEVDGTIITPGIMDKPLWMSSEMGKVIGQLKSFGFASTNKQMLAGLNNFNGYFIQGSLAAITLGALTYSIKRRQAGHEPDEDSATLIRKGIEYSGAIGMGSEAIQFAAGIGQAAGIYKGDGNFRWARQGIWGSMLGPSAGLVEDSLRAGRVFAREEPNAGDVAALRRMLPYQNLFQIRSHVFDPAEQMLKDRLRIPD